MKQEGVKNEYYIDERFGRVPIGWEIKKLKEVTNCLDSKRKPLKSEDRKNIAGDYRYYGAAGIIDYVNDYIFDGRYILFGEDGENLISRKVPQAFIVEGKFWVNNHAHILETIEGVSNMDFICYQLESKNYENIIYGSAQPKINKADLNKIRLLIPKNPQEQTAIATILSKVDETIAATQNSIKAAEKLKKALMQNLLTGKLKLDGTWRTDDEFYVDEKFGKVPKGWEVKRVKDVANCLDSKRKPIKAEDRKGMTGTYRYYGAAGIIDYINDYIFDGRYILFGEDGENLISRKVPQAFIVDGQFWVNNHAHILECIEGVSNIDFLCCLLESKNYENIVYGSAQPKINKSDLNKIKLLFPNDIKEQTSISSRLIEIDSTLKEKQTKILTLQRLKKSLMQNLLTAKVRLPQEFIAQFESGMSGNSTSQDNQRILKDE